MANKSQQNRERKNKRAELKRHYKKTAIKRMKKMNEHYVESELVFACARYVIDVLNHSVTYWKTIMKTKEPDKLANVLKSYIMDEREISDVVSKEECDKLFPFLTEIHVRQGDLFDWKQAINSLKITHELDTDKAFFVFVQWTKYLDSRKALLKAIDFS